MALREVNLRLVGPSLVQVIGPNGGGKTTLLKVILGTLEPERGLVKITPSDASLGYSPQSITSSFKASPLTVWEFIETGLKLRGVKNLGCAEDSLEKLGLNRSLWDRKISELSGGQLRRLYLARALACAPQIILLDEPFTYLDPVSKGEVAGVIAEEAKRSLVIVTSHDPELMINDTDTIIVLNRRVYAVGSPSEVLKVNLLREVYGRCVIEYAGHTHIIDECLPERG